MREPTPADATAEPFTLRSRAFWRIRWPEPQGPEGVVTVAQVVAGRYEVEGLFAAGEHTVMLRARDQRTRRPVMIKALRTDVLSGFADRRASMIDQLRGLRHVLQTERRLLVRLRNAGCNGVPNPNDYVYDLKPSLAEAGLEPALDGFLAETEPYLVLQRLSGVSLEELLATQYPAGMGERQALELIRPVVRILERLHEPWRLRSGRTWHCVYQDLKPANVLIDPLGRPTLLDFGGCQVVVDGTPVLEGSCTAGYAPPECEGPPRVLLPCADVYTIGSTLHHMLTGVNPRERLGRRGDRAGTRLDPDDVPSRCSSAVKDVLRRCLAPKPSERLADARQVARLLDPLVA
jgi:serine/threonine protein kinase